MTDLMDRTDTNLSDTDNDDDIIAHVIRKKDQMRGYIEGKEITALCGTKFIPSRDYEGRPVCGACIAEVERLRAG
jgi:hypothetical protein